MGMIQNRLAPWLGQKTSNAQEIVLQLGKHRMYHEPFMGGLGVIFQKPTCAQETLCDLHDDGTNLSMVVAERPSAVRLYERLQQTLPGEGIFELAKHALMADPDWQMPIQTWHRGIAPTPEMEDRAYWYFIASWLGRNGVSGTARLNYQMAVRWSHGGGGPAVRFSGAADSIPWWHKRLRRCMILQRDAFTYLPKIQDHRYNAIYVDPPYFQAGRTTFYKHDFIETVIEPTALQVGLFGSGVDEVEKVEKDPHVVLAGILNSFNHTRIVVSYYKDPRLEVLYPLGKWTHLDRTQRRNIRNSVKDAEIEDDSAPEVLIINGPPNKLAA